MKESKAIYSLSAEDVQTVAGQVLERHLTEREIALVEKSVGDYIDWFQAVENAIRNAVRY